MGSGNIAFPKPPDIDPEVQSLLNEQKLTLSQFNQYLSDERIQSKESQDLLKSVSPLYDRTMTKKGTAASKGKRIVFDTDRVKAISANIDRFKDVGLIYASENEIPAWVKNELARSGYDISRTMAQHNEHGNADRDPTKIWKGIAAGMEANFTPSGDGKPATGAAPLGLLKSEEYETAATEDEYSSTLNQDKLTELKDKIAKNLEFEDATNAEVNKYISEYLELSHLGAQRQKLALEGKLPVSEGTRLAKEQEYGLLQENLARRGNAAIGNTPGSSYSLSSAGNQALGQFNQRYGLIEDAERRGEIVQGAGRTGMDFGNNRSLQTSPYQQLGMLPQGNQNYAAMYPSLVGGYGQMMQPYMQNQSLQYGGLLQKYQQDMQNRQGMYQLYGMGAGALIGGLA